MAEKIISVPRPLVRSFQWVIVFSVVLTWLTGMEWFLLIPFISGLSGLFFSYNPIMKVAKQFLKKPMESYIQEDGEQLKFNQTLAVFFLGAGLISFILGWNIAGYIFTILVTVAAFVAILGFCIGCFILFQWKQYKFRRQAN